MVESKPWRNERTLRKMYVEKQMSAYEIADELGCSYDCVYRWLNGHDIERRDQSEARKIVVGSKPAYYRTSDNGYEEWKHKINGKQETVLVHRLAAVAEHGFESVSGAVIHHENEIPWDNRISNLNVMSDSKHKEYHAEERERLDNGVFK